MSWFNRRHTTPFEVVQFRHRRHPMLMRGDRAIAYFNSSENAAEFAAETETPFTDLKEF